MNKIDFSLSSSPPKLFILSEKISTRAGVDFGIGAVVAIGVSGVAIIGGAPDSQQQHNNKTRIITNHFYHINTWI
jgi:hypothetical protein